MCNINQCNVRKNTYKQGYFRINQQHETQIEEIAKGIRIKINTKDAHCLKINRSQ